jgi:hypothetical protein
MKIRLNEKLDRLELTFSGGTPDGDDNLDVLEIPTKVGLVFVALDSERFIREIHVPALLAMFKELTGVDFPEREKTESDA